MKIRRQVFPLTAAIAGIVALTATPSFASAADEAPSDSYVYVEPELVGTSIERPAMEPIPDISPDLQDRLVGLGLEGQVVSVQYDPEGRGTFYASETTWVLDLAPVSESSRSAASTTAFEYGACMGYFTIPQKVSNYLQWGGQSDCYFSNSQYYLHKVESRLYYQSGPFSALLTYIATATSSSGSNFSQVATAYGSRTCKAGSLVYEQRVTPTIRSVEYGPFWQRDVSVAGCNVAP